MSLSKAFQRPTFSFGMAAGLGRGWDVRLGLERTSESPKRGRDGVNLPPREFPAPPASSLAAKVMRLWFQPANPIGPQESSGRIAKTTRMGPAARGAWRRASRFLGSRS